MITVIPTLSDERIAYLDGLVRQATTAAAVFGFTGDIQSAPDLGHLEKFVLTAFRELRDSVGLETKRASRALSRRKQEAAAIPDQPLQPLAHFVPMPARFARVLTAKEKEPKGQLTRVAV